MELKIDPEFERLFSRMTAEEFQALKKDILEYNGLREEIEITPDGTIIDGYNRFQALKELKRMDFLRTKTKDFVGNRGAIVDYIYAKNGLRRNLNRFQKAEAAVRYLKWKKTHPSNEGRTKDVEIAAKGVGLAKATFERSKVVIEEGPEEIEDLCRNEALSINAGYGVTKAFKGIPEEPKKALAEKLKEGKIEPSEVIRAIASTKAVKAQLEGEKDSVKEKATELFKDKFWTKELDSKTAIWEIEEIAGDPHEQVTKEFGLDKFASFEEAQAWAVERNGVCKGKVEKWIIKYDPVKDKKLKEE